MKRIAILAIIAATCAGCQSVQTKTNALAERVPGGRMALDAFRNAEGASVGMEKLPADAVRIVDYVDNSGVPLTNGVRAVTTIRYERSLVDSAIAPVAVPAAGPVTNAPTNADLLNRL